MNILINQEVFVVLKAQTVVDVASADDVHSLRLETILAAALRNHALRYLCFLVRRRINKATHTSYDDWCR